MARVQALGRDVAGLLLVLERLGQPVEPVVHSLASDGTASLRGDVSEKRIKRPQYPAYRRVAPSRTRRRHACMEHLTLIVGGTTDSARRSLSPQSRGVCWRARDNAAFKRSSG